MNSLSQYLSEMSDILPNLQKIKVDTLEDGFSNKVYKLSWFQAPRMVIRIPDLPESPFLLDRQTEQSVWRDAHQKKLSPELLWSNSQGVAASEFVHAANLSWHVRHEDSAILTLVGQIQRIHQLPPVEKTYQVFAVIEHYFKELQQRLYPNFIELAAEVVYIKEALAKLPRPIQNRSNVLCHNDLNPKNVLMDQENCWVIDWEVAAMGDPLFDLAVVARSHNLTSVQIDLLLQSYGLPGSVHAQRRDLVLYMLAYGLREMAWLLLKHVVTPKDLEALECYYAFKSDASLNPVDDIERQRWLST